MLSKSKSKPYPRISARPIDRSINRKRLVFSPFIILLGLLNTVMAPHTPNLLSEGWEFRDSSQNVWRPAQVPSNVHTELMRHHLIPDPFVDLNELDVAWVAERTWHYRNRFATPPEVLAASLVFEGLDTFATVTLNGEVILTSDNMFIKHRVEVAHLLRRGDDNDDDDDDGNGEMVMMNDLEIVFTPARERGLELVRQHPEHDFIVHQTEVSRGPVRKAQYHWGWDWGPILVTCGPWRPVRFETFQQRIDEIRIDYDVDLSTNPPTVTAHMELAIIGTGETAQVHIDVVLLRSDGQIMESFDMTSDGPGPVWKLRSEKLTLSQVKLWWPVGMGQQNLYDFRVRALDVDGVTVLDEKFHRTGFRKVELVQDRDDSGQSFYFRVNGVDVFCAGSCWIPADSFTPRVNSDQYWDMIGLARKGNQNMLRVWGGGIYEDENFYAACDEHGIMVWQDFMFACASYPTYPDFLKSVKLEAEQNTRRIRKHPCVVLWCGNNEDYQLVERYNLEYDFAGDKNPESWLKTNFPARYIYEHLLPNVVAEECPGTPYHPSSPWGNGTSTTLKVDSTVGDIHQWNVWHGDMRLYQHLPDLGGRFVSEFGMAAYPHMDTIHRFVTDHSQRYPGSAALDFHNKAVGHTRRLLTYLGENFRIPASLDSFVHLTQVMQADALSWAYKSWRRQWGNSSSSSRRCGGVLAWQFNDCWPTISWSMVDYHGLPKLSYYAVRRALAKHTIAVTRKVHDWTTRPADDLWRRDTGHVDPRRSRTNVVCDVWVASSDLLPQEGRVVIRFVSIATGEDVILPLERAVEILPNGTTEVLSGYRLHFPSSPPPSSSSNSKNNHTFHDSSPDPNQNQNQKKILEEDVAILAELYISKDDRPRASDVSWPDPAKYVDFSGDRGIHIQLRGDGEGGEKVLEISATKPVKGFCIAERQGIQLDNNGLDLIPGTEPVRVVVSGRQAPAAAEGAPYVWTYVGMDQ